MALRRFLKTSVPAALDLASQTVMWTIEAILIGKLSASALAGYSMALQIVLVFFAILLTFVVGAGLIINRHLGAKDSFQANHIFGQAMMMGIIMALLFSAIWHSGAVHLFEIINEAEAASARDAGTSYLRLVAYFGPFIMINFIAVGILRAIGDTRFSMSVNLLINFINILLAPTLIYGLFGAPRLEVRGAAIAVGISHTIGFFVTFYLVRSHRTRIFLSFKELTSMAAMSEMGQHLGAEDNDLAEQTAHTAHRAMVIFVFIVIAILLLFAKQIVSVFTNEAAVIELGKRAIFLFAFAQLPKALNNVLSGNMRGAGMLRWLMMMTIIFVIIFEIGFNYVGLFMFGWGLIGIWSIQATDETIRFGINYLWFMNGSWRKKKK